MNIIFWALVIITLVFVWFCMSSAFKFIGGIGLRLFNDAKEEIFDEEITDSKIGEDSNEG